MAIRRRTLSAFVTPLCLLSVLVLTAALGLLYAAATPGTAAATARARAAAAATTTISVNGASAGRTFGGIGAISGGGGNSRLLTDYPAAQQQQILDYLFKPGLRRRPADPQGRDRRRHQLHRRLRVLIEHTSGTVNCNNGYEWWLMEQAKALNPNIKLYGLAWGAPGWIGGGSFWSTDMINYLVSWLNCATSHGLTINYLGGWNERGYNISWYEQLRSTLNADGYSSVQIVGADSDWSDRHRHRRQLRRSPARSRSSACTTPAPAATAAAPTPARPTPPPRAPASRCGPARTGRRTSTRGAPALIRSITRGYIDAELTGLHQLAADRRRSTRTCPTTPTA